MNNVSVNKFKKKKQVTYRQVEIQVTLQDGHHLVNYEIYENLQAFVSLDKRGFG